jgi:hypothetical protein
MKSWWFVSGSSFYIGVPIKPIALWGGISGSPKSRETFWDGYIGSLKSRETFWDGYIGVPKKQSGFYGIAEYLQVAPDG